jgi:lactobin A/cerein 7B family class IIb bacteriocin
MIKFQLSNRNSESTTHHSTVGLPYLSEQELRHVSGGVIPEVVAMAAVFGILLAADAGVFDAIDVGAMLERMN